MKELTISEAEELAGCRLDRRRKYATRDDGKPCDLSGVSVFSIASWTDTCSGCDGGGCHECGYQGKRRQAFWVPDERAMKARITAHLGAEQ